MTKVKNAALAAFGVAVLSLPSIGMAQSMSGPDSGWFIGGSVGQTKSGLDCTGLSCDDSDTGYRIFGGYKINKHFAVELGYADLGKTTFTGTIPIIGAVSGNASATAWDLVAVGILPIGEKFSVFGKLGFYKGDGDFSVSGAGSSSDSTTDMTYGIGVQYDFTKNLGIRGEWQQYKSVGFANTGGQTLEGDVDLISIGVVWKF